LRNWSYSSCSAGVSFLVYATVTQRKIIINPPQCQEPRTGTGAATGADTGIAAALLPFDGGEVEV
jgi:hypothetical protein